MDPSNNQQLFQTFAQNFGSRPPQQLAPPPQQIAPLPAQGANPLNDYLQSPAAHYQPQQSQPSYNGNTDFGGIHGADDMMYRPQMSSMPHFNEMAQGSPSGLDDVRRKMLMSLLMGGNNNGSI